jgi:NNMT/PNMT/TEMT family protein
MIGAETGVLNATVPWNSFASTDYWSHNYATMQPADQEIIRVVAPFLSERLSGQGPVAAAVDVGSGTNLYPALLMLPWAKRIDLTDFSARNVEWLRGTLMTDRGTWSWKPFWAQMREVGGYDRVEAPRQLLRSRCLPLDGPGVQQRSVFDLPAGRWNLGTMFFVAESITQSESEFRLATARFVHALTPGAPFAAAFMAGSNGYKVAGARYPALSIDADDAERALTGAGAAEVKIAYFDRDEVPLVRPDYDGMILATGIAGGR